MVAPQRLAVRAALTGDVTALKQAMMLDPLTAAAASTPAIWRMTDELIVAQEDYLPQFADSVEQARHAAAQPADVTTYDIWPETRFKPRTVEEMLADSDATIRNAVLRIFTGQHVRAQ
jgi:alpha-galactosidase